MDINKDTLQQIRDQVEKDCQGKKPEEILHMVKQRHLLAVKDAIQSGYYFKSALITEGVSELHKIATRNNMSIIIIYSAIKIYDLAIELADIFEDSNEVFEKVGLSPEYDHFNALTQKELIESLEQKINE